MGKKIDERVIYVLLFLALLCLSMISLNIVSAQTDSCAPTIKLVNQDPNPAMPDDYVKVLLEVTDLSNCNGLSIKLDPQYPFSLDTNDSPLQTIDSVPYAKDSKNSWMIPYKIRVDKDAFDGDYNLKLQYQAGSNGNFQSSFIEKDFNVTVKDSRIAFDAVIQEISGSSVSIAIANVGKYAANSVVVRVPQQDSFIVSGTDGQMVGNLASGDYTLVGFSVSQKTSFANNFTRGQTPKNQTQVSGSQYAQIPELQFNIAYTDNIGIRRVANMSLPLRIGNSSMVSTGAYSRSKAASNTWYSSFSNWLIIIIVLGILYFVYKRYHEVGGFKKMFQKSSLQKNSDDKLPDWIKNSKEKEKKK